MRGKLVAVLASLLLSFSAGAEPAVGSPAPDFLLQGSDGRSYALSQFVGQGGVVLAWFPKAFTPG